MRAILSPQHMELSSAALACCRNSEYMARYNFVLAALAVLHTCSCSLVEDVETRCSSARQRSEKLSDRSGGGATKCSDASLTADARLRSDSDRGS